MTIQVGLQVGRVAACQGASGVDSIGVDSQHPGDINHKLSAVYRWIVISVSASPNEGLIM